MNFVDHWGQLLSGQMGSYSYEILKIVHGHGSVSIVLGVNAESEQLGVEGKNGQWKTGREILAAKKWSCRLPMHHP